MVLFDNVIGRLRVLPWPADDKTVIELSYQIYAEQEAQWPFATELLYRIEVGENLDAALTIRNKDSMPFTFSCALHSYYAVEHINQVRIEGFDQSPYLDAMDNWSCNIQKGDILIDEEVDRIYQTAPDAITLSDAERKISIRNKNSNSTVVWNPWQEKAKRLTQFADDDYQTMLCIETANIADDVIYLESDESHTCTFISSALVVNALPVLCAAQHWAAYIASHFKCGAFVF